ncbi:hypothetical protein JOM56_001177 [Amanita muscaria]
MQPSPQPALPGYSVFWDVAQPPQGLQLGQSHVQASPVPTYNPQWTVPPPPVLCTNYDHGPQWQRPQLQYQQHQYHALPPVPQPPLQHLSCPLIPSSSNSGNVCAAQHLSFLKHRRLDDPNLNGQVQHHAPLPPQLQFKPPPLLAQNTGVDIPAKIKDLVVEMDQEGQITRNVVLMKKVQLKTAEG